MIKPLCLGGLVCSIGVGWPAMHLSRPGPTSSASVPNFLQLSRRFSKISCGPAWINQGEMNHLVILSDLWIPLVGGHLTFEFGSRFHHPKKVTQNCQVVDGDSDVKLLLWSKLIDIFFKWVVITKGDTTEMPFLSPGLAEIQGSAIHLVVQQASLSGGCQWKRNPWWQLSGTGASPVHSHPRQWRFRVCNEFDKNHREFIRFRLPKNKKRGHLCLQPTEAPPAGVWSPPATDQSQPSVGRARQRLHVQVRVITALETLAAIFSCFGREPFKLSSGQWCSTATI